MAKTWYPVIDHLLCMKCGACVKFYPHMVYDAAKAPSPVVVRPEKCIGHCRGCGDTCPKGAIAYVGDDTGWMPPYGETQKPQGPCCSHGSETYIGKAVCVEYLYLDLNTCDRCIDTGAVLDEVMGVVRPVWELAGYTVQYRKIEISTPELAERYHFLSSPTIRVNGRDIVETITETNCGCCSEISGTDIDCRAYGYEGRYYQVPPKEMLVKAILTAVLGEGRDGVCPCRNYKLPENLKRFYEGKEQR